MQYVQFFQRKDTWFHGITEKWVHTMEGSPPEIVVWWYRWTTGRAYAQNRRNQPYEQWNRHLQDRYRSSSQALLEVVEGHRQVGHPGPEESVNDTVTSCNIMMVDRKAKATESIIPPGTLTNNGRGDHHSTRTRTRTRRSDSKYACLAVVYVMRLHSREPDQRAQLPARDLA